MPQPAPLTAPAARRVASPAAALLLVGGVLLGALFAWSGAGRAAGDDAEVTREEHVTLLVDDGGEPSYVDIHMLLREGASREAVRAEMLVRFPGAVEVHEGDVSAQFVPTPYRWTAKTASFAYNAAGKPASLVNETAVIVSAATAWNTVGAAFTFTFEGPSSLATGGCADQRDRRNVAGWAPKPGNTLAMTCAWYRSDGAATEFDMEIDPDIAWTTSPSGVNFDLRSVIMHEFGHALGLDHTQSANCATAVMCASYRRGTVQDRPGPDDAAGIIAVYGASGSPPPEQTPTPAASPRSPTPTPTPRGTQQASPTPAPRVPRPYHSILPQLIRS